MNKNQISNKGGRKIRAARQHIDATKLYDLESAISSIKNCSFAKFDETFELVLKLGVDPKHSDQMVRGVVAMPHGIGKVVTVAVFAKSERLEEAKSAGADFTDVESLIEEIKAGVIKFDRCIATPDMMIQLGSVAKILGPRGLMPNPKLGTVTNNVTEAIKSIKSGQVEFRVEKAGIIHAAFGKKSFSNEQLSDNLRALVSAVNKAKPSGAKGTYLRAAYISSTMGPACKLDTLAII